MQSGSWRNQAGPSHSQPHPSDAASPSSSSSHATPVPGHLGREAIQQQQLLLLQQQQLAQRQAFEQQEPQKQVARIEQHYAQNPVHQAFLQYALQTSQNRPSENIMNQQGKMSTASSGNQGDHFSHTERQLELGNIVSGQRNDPKPSEIAAGQLVPTNMVRPSQLRQSIITTQSNANNQFTMAQMQAMQLWDKEHNFDLTVPANLNLLAQVLPHWQSSRLAAIQKQSETCTTGQQPCLPSVKQSVISSSIENEGSAYVNSISDYSSQAGPSTCPQPVSSDIMTSGGESPLLVIQWAFEQQEPQKQVARIEQHYAQNPVHQAFLQYALQTSQNRPSENIMNQQGKMSTASSGNQGDHFSHTERQLELGNIVSGQRNDPKPSEIAAGQLVPTNMVRPSQLRQSIITTQSNANNQFTMAQMQAMQLWDKEHNFDLTVPANLNLLAQVLPHWQSSRLAAIQKQSETCTTGQQPCLPSVKQSVISSSIENEGSAYVNSISDYSSQAGPSTCPQPVSSDIMTSGGETTAGKSNDLQTQARAHNRESENERAEKSQLITIDGGQIIHPPNSSSSMIMEQCYAKNAHAGNNSHQMQQLRSLQQLNRPMTQPEICSNDAVGGNQFPSQSGSAQVSNQQFGFTKQQLFLLKGQILAFRRLKCGERNLPPEVLRAIAGLPADSLPQQSLVQSGAGLQERTSAMEGMHTQMDEGLQPVLVSKDQNLPKEEPGTREEKAVTACQMPDVSCSAMEPLQSAFSAKIEESISPIIAEQETGKGNHNVHTKCDNCNEKGKAVSVEDASASTGQEKKPVFTSVCPSFTRKHDLLGSTTLTSNDMTLAYVVKDFLLDELNQQQQEIISSLCISEMFREISQSLKLLKDQCTYKKQIDRGGGDIEENKKENFKIRCAEFKKFLVQDRLDLLNTASIEELKGLKAIGKKRAEYILELRKEMSEPFKSIDDLREFGLSTKQINEMMAQALGDF